MRYQDEGTGNNQVRHLVGFVMAGYSLGSNLGDMSVIYNEITGTQTWPDVWLGERGVKLGDSLKGVFGGRSITDVGNWIRENIGQ